MSDVLSALSEIIKNLKACVKPGIDLVDNRFQFSVKLILKNDIDKDLTNVTTHVYSGNLDPDQKNIEDIKPKKKGTIAFNGYEKVKGAISWTTNTHFFVLMFIIRSFQTTEYRFLIKPVNKQNLFRLDFKQDFKQVWNSGYNPGEINGYTKYTKHGYNLVIIKRENGFCLKSNRRPRTIEIEANLTKEVGNKNPT